MNLELVSARIHAEKQYERRCIVSFEVINLSRIVILPTFCNLLLENVATETTN